MKKTGWMIIGMAAVLGIGSAVGVSAGTKKIIRFEDGKRVEVDMENSKAPISTEGNETEAPDLEFGGFETDLDSAYLQGSMTGEGNMDEAVAGEDAEGSLELGKFWGPVLEVMNGSFMIDSQVPQGYQGEIMIRIDPEKTMVIDSVTGFPAQEESLAAGQIVYVYTSPAMTMSLPPQTTAELVLVNIPQDAGVPLYVKASGALEAGEEGGYMLKTVGGEAIKVPADCPITPYLTRQMVRLEDIDAGRKCLVWLDAYGQAERIVLFNE